MKPLRAAAASAAIRGFLAARKNRESDQSRQLARRVSATSANLGWFEGMKLEVRKSPQQPESDAFIAHPGAIALFLLLVQSPAWRYRDLKSAMGKLMNRGLSAIAVKHRDENGPFKPSDNSLLASLDKVRGFMVLTKRRGRDSSKWWVVVRRPQVLVKQLKSRTPSDPSELIDPTDPEDVNSLDRQLLQVVDLKEVT
jgi:hypothetical protein